MPPKTLPISGPLAGATMHSGDDPCRHLQARADVDSFDFFPELSSLIPGRFVTDERAPPIATLAERALRVTGTSGTFSLDIPRPRS